jgi:hypothetical protein
VSEDQSVVGLVHLTIIYRFKAFDILAKHTQTDVFHGGSSLDLHTNICPEWKIPKVMNIDERIIFFF